MELQGTNIGPYVLLDLLGRGGMGVVYRAQHRQTGQLVALKTVKIPQQNLLSSIRREIHTLAGLSHPRIVRILEEGLQDGLPWYAMEMIHGNTLRDWTRSEFIQRSTGPAPTGLPDWWTASLALGGQLQQAQAPLPQLSEPRLTATPESTWLTRVLSLVQALCWPIAFLHGEGLVHRDLKPENFLVGAGDSPVLVDFGLAIPFSFELGREGLEPTGAGLGTVAYMAPEQIRGELVDARADLYALGCILYEMLTGRPPFIGKSPRAVLLQHLSQPPQPLCDLVPGLPAKLEDLVMRLLSKEARQRIGHADAVASALVELGANATPPLDLPKPRAHLYRPGFSGRQDDFLQLEQHLESVRDAGTGKVVLIGGESGVGKTRLALELAQTASRRGFLVLSGTSVGRSTQEPGQQGGSILECLRKPLEWIADRCRAAGLPETERILGARGFLLSIYEPSLAALPGQDRYSEPVELPADAARLRLYHYLSETFLALTEGGSAKPLLLILDDLHWADELTLGWLAYQQRLLMQPEQQNPMLLIGVYRTEELGQMSSGLLRALLEDPGLSCLRLGRLEENAVTQIVGDMLALNPPPMKLGRFLSQQSEGNPFFLAETLRSAVENGLLLRDSDGRWKASESDYERLGLRKSLRQLIELRFHGLPEPAQRVVAMAAVLGRETKIGLLAQMLEWPDEDLHEALSELLRRHVLDEPQPGLFRFAHDKLREVAYEGLSVQEKTEFHLKAAESLESLFLAGERVAAGSLGRHWQLASRTDRALGYFLKGANDAISDYAPEEAEQLLRAALDLLAEGSPESVETRCRLALDVLRARGKAVEAVQEMKIVLQHAAQLQRNDLALRSYRILGVLCRETGNLSEAHAYFETGLSLSASDPDESPDLAQLLGSFAVTQGELGEFALAIASFKRAIAMSHRFGMTKIEAQQIGNLGNLHKDLGDFEQARLLYEKSLAIKRLNGDRRGEGVTLLNLAAALSEQGLDVESRQHKQRALEIYREIGERALEGRALTNLGNSGTSPQNRAQFQAALQIHRECGDRTWQATTLNYAVSLERRLGEQVKAEQMIQEAAEILRQVPNQVQIGVNLCEQGSQAISRGESGRKQLEEAKAVAERIQVRSASGLGQEIAKLQRTVEAFEAGEFERLFRGELIADLPADLRKRLVESGELEEARAWPENAKADSKAAIRSKASRSRKKKP